MYLCHQHHKKGPQWTSLQEVDLFPKFNDCNLFVTGDIFDKITWQHNNDVTNFWGECSMCYFPSSVLIIKIWQSHPTHNWGYKDFSVTWPRNNDVTNIQGRVFNGLLFTKLYSSKFYSRIWPQYHANVFLSKTFSGSLCS